MEERICRRLVMCKNECHSCGGKKAANTVTAPFTKMYGCFLCDRCLCRYGDRIRHHLRQKDSHYVHAQAVHGLENRHLTVRRTDGTIEQNWFFSSVLHGPGAKLLPDKTVLIQLTNEAGLTKAVPLEELKGLNPGLSIKFDATQEGLLPHHVSTWASLNL